MIELKKKGAGGQTLYDAIVAPSGGDYTSVVAACAGEAAGASIFIRSGTYTETADVVLKDKQSLIGENREETIIDFDNAAYQIYGNALANGVTLKDFTVKNSADANGTVYLANCHYSHLKNIKVQQGTTGTHGIYFIGNYSIIEDSIITGFTTSSKYGIAYTGSYCRIYGNYIYAERALRPGNFNTIIGNYINGIDSAYGIMTGYYNSFSGNLINCGIFINGGDVQITGNYFWGGSSYKIYISNYTNNVITGNQFYYAGVFVGAGGQYNVISGNTFRYGHGLLLYGTYNTVIGNTIDDGASFTIGSASNIAKDNIGDGVDITKNIDGVRMKNTSGGSLVAGDTVVLKAVAAGNEVTTTVNQGDDLVFGMLEEGIANAAYGYVQTLGKTTKLKVDGTTDIAIRDFIGTFTTAGIGMKAAAGDMAFAIALEAYTTNDSLGVIDALIISPRKI